MGTNGAYGDGHVQTNGAYESGHLQTNGAYGSGRVQANHHGWAMPPAPGRRRRRRRLIAMWVTAGVVAVAVLGLGAWQVHRRADPLGYRTYWVPSAAMEPTYEQGEIVWTRDIAGTEVERGDVIILDLPMAEGDDMMAIKRVLAVGGDEIGLGPDGEVTVNGEAVDEPYLAPGTVTRHLPTQEVPAGHLFVMGDNRDESSDSRISGPAPTDDVLAIVVPGFGR